MNEKDKIAIYEYFEDLGYSREMLKTPKDTQYKSLVFQVEAFGKVLFYILNNEVENNEWRYLKSDIKVFVVYFGQRSNNFGWYNTLENGKYQESNLKRFHEFRPTMPEIHENIFQLLSNKQEADKRFLFRMRSRNNKGRYDKGFWFLGNDDQIIISFWAGQDWKSKTPLIFLGIDIHAGYS